MEIQGKSSRARKQIEEVGFGLSEIPNSVDAASQRRSSKAKGGKQVLVLKNRIGNRVSDSLPTQSAKIFWASLFCLSLFWEGKEREKAEERERERERVPCAHRHTTRTFLFL